MSTAADLERHATALLSLARNARGRSDGVLAEQLTAQAVQYMEAAKRLADVPPVTQPDASPGAAPAREPPGPVPQQAGPGKTQ